MNTSRPLLPAMSPHRRLGAGALAVGTGAWALHLLGLQTLLLSQAQSHSIGLTLLSWLTAVLGSAAVLSSWQAPPEHWWRHAAALLGGSLGYGGMHFIGLAAMPLPPELQASVQGDASLTAGTLAALVAAGLVQLTSHWLLESAPPPAPDNTSHDLLMQATAQLQQIAQHDALTGLTNRPAFETALRQAAERSRLHHSEFAVLCIDISRLQLINESYGQHGGDEVLRDIATRLKSCCRSGDLVARAGGDEFLLLIEAPQLRTDRLIERARSLIETLSVPLELCSGQAVQIGCSIGIAMHPLHGPAERLVAAADTATHTARRLGSNQICVFENRMHDELRQELDLLRELTQALEHDGLTLWYQPKIGCASQHVTGCEALVRWPHPQRGMIGPNVFIPLAERHGLICRLGDWITEQACRQVRQWLDQGLCFRVAINLSVHQLEQPGLVAHIRASIERHRIDPALLCFEITESVAMENVQKSLTIFHELRALGVQLSIDDFGTGYSSLSYLSRLPVQQLKIDRSFVRELDAGNNHHGRTIVDMVIRLGQTLGMKVVAEGVETDAQRQALVELGCDELQGFLYAKPMPADALTRWAIGIDRPARVQFPASIYVTATAPAETVPAVTG